MICCESWNGHETTARHPLIGYTTDFISFRAIRMISNKDVDVVEERPKYVNVEPYFSVDICGADCAITNGFQLHYFTGYKSAVGVQFCQLPNISIAIAFVEPESS